MCRILVGVCLFLIAGCTTVNTAPYIEDLSDDMVKVAINFGFPLPTPEGIQAARHSADAVALDHCASYNRRPEFASLSHRPMDFFEGIPGTHYFVYRCLDN